MFWRGCWSARSVDGVKVNGYTIKAGADLRGANFEEAKLGGADLSGANLAGARADKDTVWPEGFDPEAAGVTFED